MSLRDCQKQKNTYFISNFWPVMLWSLQLHLVHMKEEKASSSFSLFVILMHCWPVLLKFKNVHSSYVVVVFFPICQIFIYNMGIHHLLSKEGGLKFVWLQQISHFHEVTFGAEVRRMLFMSLYLCFCMFISNNLYRSKAVMWPNSLNDLEKSLWGSINENTVSWRESIS